MLSQKLLESISEVLNTSVSSLKIKNLRGGTNECFKITADTGTCFLRQSSNRSSLLAIDRLWESKILRQTSELGISPPIIYHSLEKGILITKFISSERSDKNWFRHKTTLRNMLDVVKFAHQSIKAPITFNPVQQIDNWMQVSQMNGVVFPEKFFSIVEQIKSFEKEPWYNDPIFRCFCHNDLTPKNFILTKEKVWLIDWEFSGEGNLLYDLATMTIFLPSIKKKFVLKHYFGKPTSELQIRLKKMETIVLVWNTLWATIHINQDQKNDYYKFWANYYWSELREKSAMEAAITLLIPGKYARKIIRRYRKLLGIKPDFS